MIVKFSTAEVQEHLYPPRFSVVNVLIHFQNTFMYKKYHLQTLSTYDFLTFIALPRRMGKKYSLKYHNLTVHVQGPAVSGDRPGPSRKSPCLAVLSFHF